MINLISILIGLAALFGALIGFVPLLGWLNWFVIPLAILGLVLGLMSDRNTGRNINLAVGIIAFLRLSIGHGIF